MRFCLLSWVLFWVNCIAWTLVYGNRHRITQGRLEGWADVIASTADMRRNVEVAGSLDVDLEYQLKVNKEVSGCIFYGPYQGYVPGCFNKCTVELDFEVAMKNCAESQDCAGFVEKLSEMQTAYEYRSGPDFVLNEEGSELSWVKVCDGSGKPYFGEQVDLSEYRKQQWKRR